LHENDNKENKTKQLILFIFTSVINSQY